MKYQFTVIFDTKEEMDAVIAKLESKPKNQAKLTNSKTCKTCGKEIEDKYDYCYPCYLKKDEEEQ